MVSSSNKIVWLAAAIVALVALTMESGGVAEQAVSSIPARQEPGQPAQDAATRHPPQTAPAPTGAALAAWYAGTSEPADTQPPGSPIPASPPPEQHFQPAEIAPDAPVPR